MAKRIVSKPVFNDNGEAVAKTCVKCSEIKSLDEFYKQSDGVCGRVGSCIPCFKRDRKRPEVMITAALNNARGRCKHHYKKKGIQCFLTREDVEFLWNRDSAESLEWPSLDRKDNNGDYTLENCRFIEHRINSIRERKKPIIQYTMEGEFVAEYPSASEAAKVTGFTWNSICTAARGVRPSHMGYKWKYK